MDDGPFHTVISTELRDEKFPCQQNLDFSHSFEMTNRAN